LNGYAQARGVGAVCYVLSTLGVRRCRNEYAPRKLAESECPRELPYLLRSNFVAPAFDLNTYEIIRRAVQENDIDAAISRPADDPRVMAKIPKDAGNNLLRSLTWLLCENDVHHR
jgi:hypothetical protein